jgi:hypothetical protein
MFKEGAKQRRKTPKGKKGTNVLKNEGRKEKQEQRLTRKKEM